MSAKAQLANKKIELGSPESGEVLCKYLKRIQEEWGLKQSEMAHFVRARPSTFNNWVKDGEIPISNAGFLQPELEAIIAVIAIHRSLGAMFSNPVDQRLWLDSPHPDFKSASPRGFATESMANLIWLRQYLDYIRGRGA